MRHTVFTGVYAPQEVRSAKAEGDWANDCFEGWFFNTGLTYGMDYRYSRGSFQFADAGRAMLFKLTFGGAH